MVGLFRWIYRRRPARPLDTKKPWLKWFPKYEVKVRLPPEVLQSPDPDKLLEDRLSHSGFQHEAWTKTAIHFVRGKSWGDFHAKLIKLRVSFPHPLKSEVKMRVEVARVCLFDTGDLWQIAREIKANVEAAAPSQPPSHPRS